MTIQPAVSAILTAHREGLMAGPAAQSLKVAVAQAVAQGISCEILVVLDRADSLTRRVLQEAFQDQARFIETDTGDPGQARNAAITAAQGMFSCFLDGDDLWSENWITAAYAAAQLRPDAVHHSAFNLVFGTHRMTFWHIDSESSECDQTYLDWGNYWDAMCFAKTQIFRDFPMRANDLARGFGHEDWHWNVVTITAGVAHKPVPNTIHFKRARAGSQMGKINDLGGMRWPVEGRRPRRGENSDPKKAAAEKA